MGVGTILLRVNIKWKSQEGMLRGNREGCSGEMGRNTYKNGDIVNDIGRPHLLYYNRIVEVIAGVYAYHCGLSA